MQIEPEATMRRAEEYLCRDAGLAATSERIMMASAARRLPERHRRVMPAASASGRDFLFQQHHNHYRKDTDMGTNGTNKFTDFSGTPSGSAKTQGGGPSSKADEVPLCERAINGVALEEVARAAFYKTHGAVPAVGTAVTVREKLVGGRIGVQTASGEIVGYLPTELNYLLRCMGQGYTYAGTVVSTTAAPIPVVRVDLETGK